MTSSLIMIIIIIIIKQYKTDEFVESMCSLSAEINKVKGCLSYRVYQNINRCRGS